MTISASDIEPGKCYVTGYAETRRVVAVDLTEVTYVPVSAGGPVESPERQVSISREKFAAEVDREVACPE